MEETAPKPPQPAAAKPAHAPAMDVIAPHAAAPAAKAAPAPEQVAVRPAPAAEDSDGKDKPAEPKKETVKPEEKPKKPTEPKKPGSGVGMAIFATVVIVLGLAALATYAYLKTQN